MIGSCVLTLLADRLIRDWVLCANTVGRGAGRLDGELSRSGYCSAQVMVVDKTFPATTINEFLVVLLPSSCGMFVVSLASAFYVHRLASRMHIAERNSWHCTVASPVEVIDPVHFLSPFSMRTRCAE